MWRGGLTGPEKSLRVKICSRLKERDLARGIWRAACLTDQRDG